jgi:hypothetical protein
MRRLVACLSVITFASVFGVSSASAGGGGVKQFCKANLAVDQAPEGPNKRLLRQLRNAAPDAIADAVNTGTSLFQEEGEAAFENPEFLEALQQIDEFVLDRCGYEQVDVTMQDYSFSGVPEEIKKGTTAFNLSNEGQELHEFAVLRLKADATLDDLLELPEDASEEELGRLAAEVPGGGFAFPGESDVALITLKRPGRYVAMCFIPVGTTPDAAEDGGTGPPHFTQGMTAEFEVT